MTQFADAFGPQAVRESMDRQLVPGCVVYIELRFATGPKSKYLVLAASSDTELFFMVNTAVNQFVQNRPDLNKCQVVMDAAEHFFLDHDSTIACHEVYRLPRSKVLDELTADLGRLKGEISESVREQILAAVKAAVTLDPRTQKLIIAALSLPAA
jgi:hypothetical protein